MGLYHQLLPQIWILDLLCTYHFLCLLHAASLDYLILIPVDRVNYSILNLESNSTIKKYTHREHLLSAKIPHRCRAQDVFGQMYEMFVCFESWISRPLWMVVLQVMVVR